MLRDRFMLLHQRIQRDPTFDLSTEAPVGAAAIRKAESQASIKITSIGSLMGCEGDRCVFGMLSKSERIETDAHGSRRPVWYLEDAYTKVRISMEVGAVRSSGGLITENSVVFAEGRFEDDVFTVHSLGLPPFESRESALASMKGVNLFGGKPIQEVKLTAEEEVEMNRLFIVLSDVWLDKPRVVEKLKAVLHGYEQMEPPPAAFVLMGNFLSQPVGAGNSELGLETVDGLFAQLAELFNECPTLKAESKLILVPGPADPGPGNVIPRPPLPECFTSTLRQRLPSVSMSSNPCRIRHGDKHFVFFREDLMHKMRRNCVVPPEPVEVPDHKHLAKTLLDQGHLCPLPVYQRPVHWNADHLLMLHPTPHLLVVADRAARYEAAGLKGAGSTEPTTVMNPGSFPVNFDFLAYTPANAQVDICTVPDA